MRRIYAARRRALIEALKPGKRAAPPSMHTSLMLLLRLPKGTSDETAAATLEAQGIEVQSLSSHYEGRSRQQGLLLSFAGFSEADSETAAARN